MSDQQFDQLIAVLAGIRMELERIAATMAAQSLNKSFTAVWPQVYSINIQSPKIRYVWPETTAGDSLLNPLPPASTVLPILSDDWRFDA